MSPDNEPPLSHASHLRTWLQEGQPAGILIDGHNLLYRLDDVFGIYFEHGHPRKSARNELILRLTDCTRDMPQVQIDLWFDSNTSAHDTINDQLRVHYSGGKGRNRTDRQLANMLRSSLPDAGLLFFVVSDDFGLRRQCTKLDARILACRDIAEWLCPASGTTPKCV